MNKLDRCGVYAIVHRASNRIVYIGSTINFVSRWAEHRRDLSLGTHANPRLQRAYAKYGGIYAFDFRVLALCVPEELVDIEQYFVDMLGPAYNICRKCVKSQLGIRRRPETIAKHSEAAKKQFSDPTSRARWLDAIHSPNHRAILSATMRARHAQETPEKRREVNAKISASHRGMRYGPERCVADSARLKTLWADPEYRARMSAAHRHPWTKAQRIAREIRPRAAWNKGLRTGQVPWNKGLRKTALQGDLGGPGGTRQL